MGRRPLGALVWEYVMSSYLLDALVGYSNKNHQPSGALSGKYFEDSIRPVALFRKQFGDSHSLGAAVGKHFGNSFLRLHLIEGLNEYVIAQLRPIDVFNKGVIVKLHPIEHLNESVIVQLRPIEGLNGSESAPGVHEIE